VLFEKSERLGGILSDVCLLPFKEDMKDYVEWLRRSTLGCGADIRLGVEATPENVLAENPDAIVVAAGSVPIIPPVPGIDSAGVVNVMDTDSGRAKIPSGSRVVVCGGGLSGCESGLALAMDGCNVTIVDMLPVDSFASGAHDLVRNMLMQLLVDNGVDLIGDSLVRKINENSVDVEGKSWNYSTVEADYIVNAFGMKKNQAVIDAFNELIPDVYFVGDCLEVKNILHANFTAYDRSCNI